LTFSYLFLYDIRAMIFTLLLALLKFWVQWKSSLK